MGKIAVGLLLLSLTQPNWAQIPQPDAPAQVGWADDSLEVFESVEDLAQGSQKGSSTPANFDRLLAGEYPGMVFRIECLPFSFEESSDGHYRYWAYLTDETGFGWIEDEPLIVTSEVPANLVDADGKIRGLSTLVRIEKAVLFDHETGTSRSFQVPVFELVGPSP